MPKVKKSDVTYYHHDITLAPEHVVFTKEAKECTKHIGHPTKHYKPPPSVPLVQHILLKEEYAEIRKEHEEHMSNMSLLNRLTKERDSLEKRIASSTSLLDRITPCETKLPTFSQPIPTSLHFKQTKKILRIDEFQSIIRPTLNRLEPVFKALQSRVDSLPLPQEKLVEEELNDPIWEWFNRLQDIEMNFEEIGHKFKNSDWRKLKGACKRISKVSFNNPATRLVDIRKELLSLDITLP